MLADWSKVSILKVDKMPHLASFQPEVLERSLKYLLVVSASAALLSGCVGEFAKTPDWPWEKPPCTGACSDDAAVQAYSDAITYCSKIQEYYYRGGKYIAGGRFATAAVGTLAGAVLAPITSGAASTAWSGISGSSNALQASMDDNFAQAAAIRRRASVAEAGKAGILAYMNATTPSSKVTIAVSMAFNCSVAGAAADSSSLRAITAAPVETPSGASNASTSQASSVSPVIPKPVGPVKK